MFSAIGRWPKTLVLYAGAELVKYLITDRPFFERIQEFFQLLNDALLPMYALRLTFKGCIMRLQRDEEVSFWQATTLRNELSMVGHRLFHFLNPEIEDLPPVYRTAVSEMRQLVAWWWGLREESQ